MKKFLSILLSLVSIICLNIAFSGCSGNSSDNNNDISGVNGFYTVTAAYKRGFLTREQILSIAYYHNGGTYKNESIMGKNFAPLSKSPETLSTETDNSIINSFYNSDYWEYYENYKTINDISYNYYGTYGNSIALKIWVGVEAVDDVVWEEKLDDVTIYYRNSKRILIFVNEVPLVQNYE